MTATATDFLEATIHSSRSSNIEPTNRVIKIAAMFGLGLQTDREITIFPKPQSPCPLLQSSSSPAHRVGGNQRSSTLLPKKPERPASTDSTSTPRNPTLTYQSSTNCAERSSRQPTPSQATASVTPGPSADATPNSLTAKNTATESPTSPTTPPNVKPAA